MRILLAEDEALVAMDFEAEVEDRGLGEVVIVHTLADAKEKIATDHFDWAVLDLNLPDGQTFELADQLVSKGVKICFTTGADIQPATLALYDARAFAKPVSMPDICNHFSGNP
ncbi:response regulator [Sulfitobacter sp. S190]|uniref:response regulator n=1 Tax=Sulfitobacter sp. S190 TaxID=2867022 RepID=UPI0021A48821|nr:response regulator [Sulfitobacter sp. S190]UWR21231.1 response regulator [Sulfitobacter sp. S190]